MSKYENEYHGGQISQSTLSTYQSIVESVKPFLPDSKARIIDVGCATGGLLAVFVENGYPNVIGVDPSPACARTAQNLYSIRVLNCAISEVPQFEEPFDFLILNSVLEHIRDLNTSLTALRNLLIPGGMIWVEVPDVTRFSDQVLVGFQQFSMEHVNFFSPISLSNIMLKNGYSSIALWQNVRQLESIIDPALSTIFKRVEIGSLPSDLVQDRETKPSLSNYIERSQETDQDVFEKIKAIVSGGRPILIWGVGTHTQRLLATSLLSQANIKAFIDSNPRYQGKQLFNKPILSPAVLQTMPEPILISSRLYQEEILAQIRFELHLSNEILTLYETKSN